MTRNPIYVMEDDLAAEAVKAVSNRHIDDLVVLDVYKRQAVGPGRFLLVKRGAFAVPGAGDARAVHEAAELGFVTGDPGFLVDGWVLLLSLIHI